MEILKGNAAKIKWIGIGLLTIVAAAHILTSVMGWIGIAATFIGCYYGGKTAPQKKEADEE